jgi:KaiC/GvpD/RAD55 family RecA-like ATPase
MTENGENEDKTRRAMKNTAEFYDPGPDPGPDPQIQVVPGEGREAPRVPSGIRPLDERVGGLVPGGVYLFAGPPGPEKLVATLQFLHAGISEGERGLLLAGAQSRGVLEVARAWGCDMDAAWRDGRLEILGFRDDFEMRVLRSTNPEDVLEELDRLVPKEIHRIAVDPGSMFLQGGARTLLGRVFMEWAQNHPATVCATLPLDNATNLPSTTEWLLQATNGVFQFDRRPDGFLQVRVNQSVPGSFGEEEAITLQLNAGEGLTAPVGLPARRRSDRPAGEPNKLLLVSLGGAKATETETWARRSFETDVVDEALGAVARLQGGASYGGILIHAPRKRIQEAVRTCGAIRPMTGAAVVVASDEPVRSTDRVDLLKAGADDCLSGGIDFRELGARIRQAVEAGGKAAAPLEVVEDDPTSLVGGAVTRGVFSREVAARAADPALEVFCVIRVRAHGGSGATLGPVLENGIRDEDGDLVFCGSGECLVLLQGARREPGKAFLSRVRQGLVSASGSTLEPETEILVHPNDRDRIGVILGESGKASGGPGGQEA